MRFKRSEDSLSKKERLSAGISGNKEISSVVVEVDLVSEEEKEEDVLITFLLSEVCGELLPMDKGGELGEVEVEGDVLLLLDLEEVTTSDREGDNRVSVKRNLGGASTELLRERVGVGGSVEGLRERVSRGFRERGCICIKSLTSCESNNRLV